MITITLNDEIVGLDELTTVEGLLHARGFPDRGIAVALDSSVLPRSEWRRTLTDGTRVDVVTAVQGG